MPSGHAQISVLVSTFWILYLINHHKKSFINIISILVFILIPFFIMYSRFFIGCHNFLQLFIGAFLGFFLGCLLYYIIDYYYFKKILN
jgi:membrane-associated phospholipid phosphatase